MKKIYLFKMFLMAFVLMLLGGVNASAEEVAYKTLTFGSTVGKGVQDYTSTWTATIGNDKWSIANFNNNNWTKWNYIRCGSNKKASVASITTSFSIDKPISSVVVTIDAVTAANVNSTKLYVSTTADFSNIIETVSVSIAKGDLPFKIQKPQENCYYKLEIDCQKGKSNGLVQISKVVYNYETSSTSTPTTAVIFDFTANPNVWGIAPTTNNKVSNTDGRTDLVVDGVTLTTTSSTSADYNYKTCIFSSTSGIDLRVYKDGTLTFTAPEDYTISKIVFTGTVGLESKVGTLDSNSNVWTTTDGVNSVVFTRSATTYIQTAAITLVPSVENKTMVATDKEAYYSTFSCDRAVVFTNDVIVNAVTIEDGILKLTALTTGDYKTTNSTTETVTNGYYVPANTGVLISAKNANITYYTAVTDQDHASLPNNQLVAATTNGKFEGVTGYKYYKLAYDDYEKETGLGFYYGEADGAPFVVKKGLAYLAVPVISGGNLAAGYSFGGNGGDDTTGINGIENDNVNETQTIYNMQGQRVEKAGLRGIYIVNGKKVVLK